MKRLLAVLFVLATGANASAAPIVVSFNSDTTGGKGNTFASTDSALVTFIDTVGTGLIVDSFFESNFSRALAVLSDEDGSKLRMNFSAAMGYLSLDFGNDEDFFTTAGDLAWLQVFSGATLVGTSTVVLNRNDRMDQTIVFSGAAFDNALFWFGTPGGSPVTKGLLNGQVEVVDNVTFDVAAVPEPGTLTLLGLALVGSTMRRRRS